jgi:hypothetical protein
MLPRSKQLKMLPFSVTFEVMQGTWPVPNRHRAFNNRKVELAYRPAYRR